jgi:hypothetical protein
MTQFGGIKTLYFINPDRYELVVQSLRTEAEEQDHNPYSPYQYGGLYPLQNRNRGIPI